MLNGVDIKIGDRVIVDLSTTGEKGELIKAEMVGVFESIYIDKLNIRFPDKQLLTLSREFIKPIRLDNEETKVNSS